MCVCLCRASAAGSYANELAYHPHSQRTQTQSLKDSTCSNMLLVTMLLTETRVNNNRLGAYLAHVRVQLSLCLFGYVF